MHENGIIRKNESFWNRTVRVTFVVTLGFYSAVSSQWGMIK